MNTKIEGGMYTSAKVDLQILVSEVILWFTL